MLDYLDRAALLYGDRIGVIDEPDQPAASWGEVTYARMAELARAQAAGLDELGVAHGERVAIVTQNAARLLTAFFGVSGYGRVLVPINFRLNHAEVGYIVEHSGATVLLVDPELDDSFADVPAKHTFVIGDARPTRELCTGSARNRSRGRADEDATATINYTSGTTARPKGVQLTHRNLWLNAATFGWQMGVDDRDVYLHTLPMFHCNGWGMPYAVTGMGGRQVVLRKVDGAEILRRVDAHGVTLMCGAPAVVAAVLDAAAEWDGPIPGRGRVRIVVAGAPPPTRTIERVETELGWEFIQIYGLTETSPLLTMNRGRGRVRRPVAERARAQARPRRRAGARRAAARSTTRARCWRASNVVLEGYWEQPDATADAIVDGWFHTGDGGTIDDDGYLSIADRKKDVIISGGENVSSIEVEDALCSHPAGRRGRGDRRARREVGRDGQGVRGARRQGGTATEAELIEHCRGAPRPLQVPDDVSSSATSSRRTATGKLQKFKLRAPYWEGRTRHWKFEPGDCVGQLSRGTGRVRSDR